MQAFGLAFKGALMEDAAGVDGFERCWAEGDGFSSALDHTE
jgi:hypothetical protein